MTKTNLEIGKDLKRPIIAICYDFDRTLSKSDMQEFEFIPSLEMTPSEFWGKCTEYGNRYQMDRVLAYMYVMVELAKQKGKTLKYENMFNLGKTVKLFDGVETWFSRINEYGKKMGVDIEHYIISSGNKEIILGSSIANEFKEIFASEFVWDPEGNAVWPSQAVNYTVKTQYLYRISKGEMDLTDDKSVNKPMDDSKKRIPFSNIIYIGDSDTDIPSMRLTIKNGGYAIGVYNPEDGRGKNLVEDLILSNRIQYYAPADYTEDQEMEFIVKNIINKVYQNNLLHEVSRKLKNKILK